MSRDEIDVEQLVSEMSERDARVALCDMIRDVGRLTQAVEATGHEIGEGESAVTAACALLDLVYHRAGEMLVVSSIARCARCGGEHDGPIEARELVRPFAPPEAAGVVWTHWFPCPANGDPVLVACDASGGAP